MDRPLRSLGPQMGALVVQPDVGQTLSTIYGHWNSANGLSLVGEHCEGNYEARKESDRLVRRSLHLRERTSSGNMQFTGTVPRSELT